MRELLKAFVDGFVKGFKETMDLAIHFVLPGFLLLILVAILSCLGIWGAIASLFILIVLVIEIYKARQRHK